DCRGLPDASSILATSTTSKNDGRLARPFFFRTPRPRKHDAPPAGGSRRLPALESFQALCQRCRRRPTYPPLMPPGTAYTIDIHPRIPARLARLSDLAGNLWYSFDRPTRILFARLHPALWEAVGHCPKAVLRRIDEHRLLAAADDPSFIQGFHRVLAAFDTYMSEPIPQSEAHAQDGLVAYFCAEFGIHESLPIYSGGLGILAGDHCKAASDRRLP